MSCSFVVAEAATGVIRQACIASVAWEAVQEVWVLPPGCILVQTAEQLVGDLDHYRVVGGQVEARPPISATPSVSSIAADGVTECVLSGLPDPCTVLLMGAVQAGPLVVEGGSLTLTTSTPGEIRIRITADPIWKPWEGTIHAT